ncbi:hypothetical protein RhiirA4_481330 [Rhizophagus irregularis]|uniref:Uncharacterized protein n=1 Tax=Rhizophagus irregularis TaxID=588596 RepID=A0A2I1HJD1_9GLOM|nr:hypothetical protein RhiirA4_481330 [Rhizophagus irregularis]
MNIIALMPATEAYEILLRNWGGYSDVSCCVWEEDYQRNFLTYIPPASPRDANGRFGSVSVLNPRFSAETELTAKPTDKTELQNRSQNYCKIE